MGRGAAEADRLLPPYDLHQSDACAEEADEIGARLRRPLQEGHCGFVEQLGRDVAPVALARERRNLT